MPDFQNGDRVLVDCSSHGEHFGVVSAVFRTGESDERSYNVFLPSEERTLREVAPEFLHPAPRREDEPAIEIPTVL